MKSSKNIISHITSFGKFQNVKTIQYLDKIKSILPTHLQKKEIINFMYLRNNVLFLALNHQGFKMEIDMKMKTLKPIIQNMQNMIEDFPKIEDVKTFVTNKASIEESFEEDISDITFEEKSTGDFFVNTDSENLREVFDEIRGIIKKHVK